MIRINLLPEGRRRRRSFLRGKAVGGVVMVCVWGLVMVVGCVWLAWNHAQVAQLRAEEEEVKKETRRVMSLREHAELARRQQVLRVRREALGQLRRERQSPLSRLEDLAALFGEEPRLRLLGVSSEGAEVWRVVGMAGDAVVLGELVGRLRASDCFELKDGPAYTRTGAGELRFQVELGLRAGD